MVARALPLESLQNDQNHTVNVTVSAPKSPRRFRKQCRPASVRVASITSGLQARWLSGAATKGPRVDSEWSVLGSHRVIRVENS